MLEVVPAAALLFLLFAAPSATRLIESGVAAYRSRDFSLAESQLRSALKLDPGHIQARTYLARTLIQERSFGPALAEIRALLKNGDPNSQFEAGRLLQELGSGRAAELQRAAPDSPDAHLLRARSLEAANQLPEAFVEYRAVLARNPSNPGVHAALGNLAWRERDLARAEEEFAAELSRTPNHTSSNLRMGQIRIAQDRAPDAVPFLRRALQSDPALLAAHRDLGRALRATGNFDEALREFQIVASRKPGDDSIHAQLASVYKSLNEPTKAEEQLRIHREILRRKLDATQAAQTAGK